MLIRLIGLSLLLAVQASVSGCASNPAGGSSVVVSSASGEVSIGREMHQQMVAEGALYQDSALQEYVSRVGQRLVAASHMPEKDFSFYVVDSEDINAFALPGGFIYINRGLLALLENEAELAGVLGHEIAHVTARHHGRRKAAGVTNTAMAVTVLILTGSGGLANASNMYGAELLSGYGREMELEADELGAQYMYRAGYEPEALLEVIGVLKDYERFQIVSARSAGKQTRTYHGLYATHPRNDKRLQRVVRAAAELDLDTYVDDPAIPGEFKRHVDGIVWGESVQGEREDNRFYHNKLDFSFEVPEGWRVKSSATSIVAHAPDDSARVTLTLQPRQQSLTPRAVLEGSATGNLSAGRSLDLAQLEGYTAKATIGAVTERLAVVDYASFTYLFEGEATNFKTADTALLTVMESFRPILRSERHMGPGNYVRYVQVAQGETIETLTAGSAIDEAEQLVRLMNGLYPAGEVRTGDWIKIIE